MRIIQKRMFQFLDERLKINGLAQFAIRTRDLRLLFTEAAKVCVGIRERTGNNDGPMVELIQKTVDNNASGEAWCMAFIQTCLAYAEMKTAKVSPIVASEHCMTVWAQSPKEQRVIWNPLPGAIVIWRHGDSTSGHTGVVLGADEKMFHAVEGNTTSGNDPKGKIVREGGGVYYTTRSRDGDGDMNVVGYLKPF